jgi:YgiT-type zinc finger domain-containing protein
MRSKGENNMTCHRCGSLNVTEQLTDLPFKLDTHQVLIVKNTPCHICEACGEIIINDKTMQRIDQIIEHVRELNTELEVVRFAA